MSTQSLPPIVPYTSMDVSGDERSSAIDFVNRLNFLFEEWDTPKILQAFVPDAKVLHVHGTLHGHEDIIEFWKKVYPPFIPGVHRHASNHIVDRDEETGGVSVRYHNYLYRYAWPDDTEGIKGTVLQYKEDTEGLPALWNGVTMMDRLVLSADGWKLKERVLGGLVANKELMPDAKSKK
ncbi:hypothetical protein AA0114_g10193 [Alternaria tenuissima]|uniref:SnoaL-like domain-containing protein n=1 Tax=Alternaria tenuissima TaxID=119927 RepID=A0A4Q4M4T9_9PLEO|nr:hypothetical protein AA0114_g10193 [Alternaria tenuissima]